MGVLKTSSFNSQILGSSFSLRSVMGVYEVFMKVFLERKMYSSFEGGRLLEVI